MANELFELVQVGNLDDVEATEREWYEFAIALSFLHLYVANRAFARALRAEGLIESALNSEQIADQAFKMLPDHWRW